jgi:hypothetical protein
MVLLEAIVNTVPEHALGRPSRRENELLTQSSRSPHIGVCVLKYQGEIDHDENCKRGSRRQKKAGEADFQNDQRISEGNSHRIVGATTWRALRTDGSANEAVVRQPSTAADASNTLPATIASSAFSKKHVADNPLTREETDRERLRRARTTGRKVPRISVSCASRYRLSRPEVVWQPDNRT